MTKTWPCEHIKRYCDPHDRRIQWWESIGFDIDGLSNIPRDWKFCPICGAKRPKGKKRR